MENAERTKWFWSIIYRAELDREKLRVILNDFSKEDIIKFQEEFIEASIELQDEPFTDYMEESEDGIEDIANWIVSNGEKFYYQIIKKPKLTPNSVNELTSQILYGIADEVCFTKYGESTGIY